MGATADVHRLRGVNLGGWLVLEKWMTPSLFAGLAATDETTWCAELGACAHRRGSSAHWDSFITRDDFAWLAGVGINAVRIPVGHWIFGPPYPYHAKYGPNDRIPSSRAASRCSTGRSDWATEFGLEVILDLHAAPGCQNGFDNGGMLGRLRVAHPRAEYLAHSVDVLGRLADRYGAFPPARDPGAERAPLGRAHGPAQGLLPARLPAPSARHCAPERVAVVFHDGFRSAPGVRRAVPAAGLPRTWSIDMHRYQCFDRADIDMDIHGHLHKAGVLWRTRPVEIQRELGLAGHRGGVEPGAGPQGRVPLGGRALQPCARSHWITSRSRWRCGPMALPSCWPSSTIAGWFFWSYRTETTPAWCFRECVERGWLPPRVSVRQLRAWTVLASDPVQHDLPVVQRFEPRVEADGQHGHVRAVRGGASPGSAARPSGRRHRWLPP